MRNRYKVTIIYILAVAYYLIILHYTIFSRLAYYGSHIELRPFRFIYYIIKNIIGTYERFLIYGFSATLQMHNISVIADFFLNIVMFIPFGFAMSILNKYSKITYIIIGLLLSLIVELLEFFTQRGCFELDDLIANTVGVCLGAFIYNGIISLKSNMK